MQQRLLFLAVLLFLFLFIEGSLSTTPLVLVVLVLTAVFTRSPLVFFAGFFSGMLLDSLAVRHLGQSSLYFVLFLFLLFLYERKFEIKSFPFVTITSSFGALGYGIFLQQPFAFQQALVSGVVASILYLVTSYIGNIGVSRKRNI